MDVSIVVDGKHSAPNKRLPPYSSLNPYACAFPVAPSSLNGKRLLVIANLTACYACVDWSGSGGTPDAAEICAGVR
jgi:hypothetical protein